MTDLERQKETDASLERRVKAMLGKPGVGARIALLRQAKLKLIRMELDAGLTTHG